MDLSGLWDSLYKAPTWNNTLPGVGRMVTGQTDFVSDPLGSASTLYNAGALAGLWTANPVIGGALALGSMLLGGGGGETTVQSSRGKGDYSLPHASQPTTPAPIQTQLTENKPPQPVGGGMTQNATGDDYDVYADINRRMMAQQGVESDAFKPSSLDDLWGRFKL